MNNIRLSFYSDFTILKVIIDFHEKISYHWNVKEIGGNNGK